MEWLCPTCATPAVLGKFYLSEDRLALAVEYCKAVDDYSIYFNVCRQVIYISVVNPSDVLKLSICLVVSAQKNREWATLADFLVHFAGRYSLLDLHGLYALSRVGN